MEATWDCLTKAHEVDVLGHARSAQSHHFRLHCDATADHFHRHNKELVWKISMNLYVSLLLEAPGTSEVFQNYSRNTIQHVSQLVLFGERVDLDVLIAAFGRIAESFKVPHSHILCTFVPVPMLILAPGPRSLVLRPFRMFLCHYLLISIRGCAQCGSVAFLSSVNDPSPEQHVTITSAR